MRLFGRQNKYEQNNVEINIVNENKPKTDYSINKESALINEKEFSRERAFPTGDRNKDLMILIGDAIDRWVELYHLQGIPRKAILSQVIGLMDAWNRDL